MPPSYNPRIGGKKLPEFDVQILADGARATQHKIDRNGVIHTQLSFDQDHEKNFKLQIRPYEKFSLSDAEFILIQLEIDRMPRAQGFLDCEDCNRSHVFHLAPPWSAEERIKDEEEQKVMSPPPFEPGEAVDNDCEPLTFGTEHVKVAMRRMHRDMDFSRVPEGTQALWSFWVRQPRDLRRGVHHTETSFADSMPDPSVRVKRERGEYDDEDEIESVSKRHAHQRPDTDLHTPEPPSPNPTGVQKRAAMFRQEDKTSSAQAAQRVTQSGGFRGLMAAASGNTEWNANPVSTGPSTAARVPAVTANSTSSAAFTPPTHAPQPTEKLKRWFVPPDYTYAPTPLGRLERWLYGPRPSRPTISDRAELMALFNEISLTTKSDYDTNQLRALWMILHVFMLIHDLRGDGMSTEGVARMLLHDIFKRPVLGWRGWAGRFIVAERARTPEIGWLCDRIRATVEWRRRDGLSEW